MDSWKRTREDGDGTSEGWHHFQTGKIHLNFRSAYSYFESFSYWFVADLIKTGTWCHGLLVAVANGVLFWVLFSSLLGLLQFWVFGIFDAQRSWIFPYLVPFDIRGLIQLLFLLRSFILQLWTFSSLLQLPLQLSQAFPDRTLLQFLYFSKISMFIDCGLLIISFLQLQVTVSSQVIHSFCS